MGSYALIVGAGPVGCTLAILLAQQGKRVHLLERRSDPRLVGAMGGRSINLALSARGLAALQRVGLRELILKDATAMSGRILHTKRSETRFIPYSSQAGRAIQSVNRGTLNLRLLERALSFPTVTCEFDCRVCDCDPIRGTVTAAGDGSPRVWEGDLIVGADGAYSAVRSVLEKRENFDYSQEWLTSGYKEIHLSPSVSGGWRMSNTGLHIWPRGRSMMIGLPNADGSFTCTIFWPWKGVNSFDSIRTTAEVTAYFQAEYPDFPALVPDLAAQFAANPTGSLVTVRCAPWSMGRAVLVGDAAHAIVPFFGQGVNAGMTGATLLADALARHGSDTAAALADYEREFKPHANAIAEMALANFVEMRSTTARHSFLLRKWLEHALHHVLGDRYLPLYEMISFTTIPYGEARARASRQWDRVVACLIALGGVGLALLVLAATMLLN
ncbi:MAG: FAD-dependent monooxygenase [Phycisphaerales bacterium]|nr:FAD-dependent monooxygenase [Phycisphaerales bacterium]